MAAKRKCKYGRRRKGKCPRKKVKAKKPRTAAQKRASYEKGLRTERARFDQRYPNRFTEQDARDFIANTPVSISVNRDGSLTLDR